MDYDAVEKLQCTFCINRASDYVPAAPESKLGLAISNLGKLPVNGLRHPPEGGTNGWYVWFGEELSSAPDFFVPLHTAHLSEYCPEIIEYLGLQPGFRFLKAGDYLDIWYDATLLDDS